jgi:hypothetical protein
LESFVYNSKETLHNYELLYNELQQADLSNNVARAQDAIETHMTVFKDQLSRVNIDPLMNDGQYLLNMLRGNTENETGIVRSQQQQRTYPLDYFDEARKISLVKDLFCSVCTERVLFAFCRLWIIFVRRKNDVFNYGIRKKIV